MKINKKKFIYLISPNKISNSFYSNLKLVLKTEKVSFFQLRLKSYSQNKKMIIGEKIKIICKKNKVKFIINDDPLLALKLDADGWMWMLHGDVGEDNSKAGVLNEKDSTPGQWIESGPHLMLMPKDPSSLDNMNTDFSNGSPYVMFPKTVYAHVMIPIEGYYKYQKKSEPKS